MKDKKGQHKFMGNYFKVSSLPLGETTSEGSFFAMVNDENVGTDGRCFWDTEADAEACARRYILAMENTK